MIASLRTVSGGRIDRNKPVRFTFDGRTYQGFAGDTLASALLANGVKLFGRSYKYHRPRGVISVGPAGAADALGSVEIRARVERKRRRRRPSKNRLL